MTEGGRRIGDCELHGDGQRKAEDRSQDAGVGRQKSDLGMKALRSPISVCMSVHQWFLSDIDALHGQRLGRRQAPPLRDKAERKSGVKPDLPAHPGGCALPLASSLSPLA
jgi:hypothetical protein